MSAHANFSPEDRVRVVVQRLLTQRAVEQRVGPHDDLRQAGLTSLDMINLVLSIEAEFDVMVPEDSIDPANFRTIDAIGRLVTALLASV
jgi:acyl carrier protein